MHIFSLVFLNDEIFFLVVIYVLYQYILDIRSKHKFAKCLEYDNEYQHDDSLLYSNNRAVHRHAIVKAAHPSDKEDMQELQDEFLKMNENLDEWKEQEWKPNKHTKMYDSSTRLMGNSYHKIEKKFLAMVELLGEVNDIQSCMLMETKWFLYHAMRRGNSINGFERGSCNTYEYYMTFTTFLFGWKPLMELLGLDVGGWHQMGMFVFFGMLFFQP